MKVVFLPNVSEDGLSEEMRKAIKTLEKSPSTTEIQVTSALRKSDGRSPHKKGEAIDFQPRTGSPAAYADNVNLAQEIYPLLDNDEWRVEIHENRSQVLPDRPERYHIHVDTRVGTFRSRGIVVREIDRSGIGKGKYKKVATIPVTGVLQPTQYTRGTPHQVYADRDPEDVAAAIVLRAPTRRFTLPPRTPTAARRSRAWGSGLQPELGASIIQDERTRTESPSGTPVVYKSSIPELAKFVGRPGALAAQLQPLRERALITTIEEANAASDVEAGTKAPASTADFSLEERYVRTFRVDEADTFDGITDDTTVRQGWRLGVLPVAPFHSGGAYVIVDPLMTMLDANHPPKNPWSRGVLWDIYQQSKTSYVDGVFSFAAMGITGQNLVQPEIALAWTRSWSFFYDSLRAMKAEGRIRQHMSTALQGVQLILMVPKKHSFPLKDVELTFTRLGVNVVKDFNSYVSLMSEWTNLLELKEVTVVYAEESLLKGNPVTTSSERKLAFLSPTGRAFKVGMDRAQINNIAGVFKRGDARK